MQKDFSVVIPVLNEEESLRELLSNIRSSFTKSKKTFEIIFIDDGSTDGTLDLLKTLKKSNKEIKIYSFRRNMGKSPALMLGFSKATGDFIVTLDADLQDDPSNIAALHQKMVKGNYDLVTGWRKNRKDKPFKIISSKIFNKLVSVLFGVHLNDLNSGLKLYRSETAKELQIYGGMHRFIPVIANEMGYRVTEKDATHHPRKYGVSKYKFSKIFTDIPDLFTIYFVTKYNRRPLHFFGKIGGVIFAIGSVILLYLFWLRLLGETIGNRPLLLFGVLLIIASMHVIFTGLLADLIVNMNPSNTKDYPLKYVEEN